MDGFILFPNEAFQLCISTTKAVKFMAELNPDKIHIHVGGSWEVLIAVTRLSSTGSRTSSMGGSEPESDREMDGTVLMPDRTCMGDFAKLMH
jgi:hypothetical protein